MTYTFTHQVARAGRSLDKFFAFQKHHWQQHTDEYEHCKDAGYHFFQDCWHIKDWIKNDTSLNMTTEQKQVIEDAFSNDANLSIAGSVANGSKHLAFGKVDNKSGLARRDFGVGQVNIGPEFREGSAKMSIEMKIDEESAFEIAKKCMKAVSLITEGLRK